MFHRILLRLPPEAAHGLALAGLRVAQATPLRRLLTRRYVSDRRRLKRFALGRSFPNPIGLAAGFDKDGLVVPGMASLGFGWLEVGAVTPRPQPGSPKPRLFRHPAAQSLENAMGFNNRGGERLRRRLVKSYPAAVPLFVNLGRNKTTPNERALDDYLSLLEMLSGLADGFVLNVSSPNTPGLRELQQEGQVETLVGAAKRTTAKSVLVKLSPDLADEAAARTTAAAIEAGADGIVLANTTTRYDLLPSAKRIGGLSGGVLRRRSFELLQLIAPICRGRATLVSVGGIDSGKEVYRRVRAGADLVQLYTALVFHGPGLIRRTLDELDELLLRDGFSTLDEAVGTDIA